MTTEIDLDAIRERERKATPGPWKTGEEDRCSHVVGRGFDTACLLHANRKNDAAFIAHAREDIPALLALVEELRAQLQQAQSERDELRRQLEETNYIACFTDTHIGDD